MVSSVLLFLLFLGLMGLVFYLWLRERRYLKKKASEAMSEEVWEDIVEEREEALRRHRLFQETLEKEKNRANK